MTPYVFVRFLFCATCSEHRPCQVVPVHNKLGWQVDQHTDVKVLLAAQNIASAGVSPPTADSLFSLRPRLPFSRALVRNPTHKLPGHSPSHRQFLLFLPEGRRLTEKIFSPCVNEALFGCQIYRTSCLSEFLKGLNIKDICFFKPAV